MEDVHVVLKWLNKHGYSAVSSVFIELYWRAATTKTDIDYVTWVIQNHNGIFANAIEQIDAYDISAS